MIYFIQSGIGGPIKIGTAKNVRKRLESLQTATPQKLILLGAIPGGRSLEFAWHRQFRRHRLDGEWFRPHQDLLTAIKGFCFPQLTPSAPKAPSHASIPAQEQEPLPPAPITRVVRISNGFDRGEPVAVVRAWGMNYLAARDRGFNTHAAWRLASRTQTGT